MLKKAITFEDLDGKQVTEVFHFGLSKADLAEMQLGAKGGSLEALVRAMIADEDGQKIIDTFKMIIQKSVGRRGEDGRRFIKSQEITDAFMQSDAYSELFMELVSDAKAGAEFINMIVPSGLAKPQDKAVAVDTARELIQSGIVEAPRINSTAATELENLGNMSWEELQEAYEKLRQAKFQPKIVDNQ
jgi:hypothetical protein